MRKYVVVMVFVLLFISSCGSFSLSTREHDSMLYADDYGFDDAEEMCLFSTMFDVKSALDSMGYDNNFEDVSGNVYLCLVSKNSQNHLFLIP